MIIGDSAKFALESHISTAYSHPGLRALGLFVIYVCGRRYGVFNPRASMLACSFDRVTERIRWRGRHTAPFSSEPEAKKIADAYRYAVFAPDQEANIFLGLSWADFRDLIYERKLVWAPDGDEAFDDWSHVLQFDEGERVRLIAFTCSTGGYGHQPETLSDLWLGADEFYGILEKWRQDFETEWSTAVKVE